MVTNTYVHWLYVNTTTRKWTTEAPSTEYLQITVNFTYNTYNWLQINYIQQLSISTELSEWHRHQSTNKSPSPEKLILHTTFTSLKLSDISFQQLFNPTFNLATWKTCSAAVLRMRSIYRTNNQSKCRVGSLLHLNQSKRFGNQELIRVLNFQKRGFPFCIKIPAFM